MKGQRPGVMARPPQGVRILMSKRWEPLEELKSFNII